MVRHLPTYCLAAVALLAAPPALAADAKQMEENKKIVAAFYDDAVNQKDFEKASQYLGARYTQHNPLAADGREGFKGFITFLKDKFPNNRSEIKRIFADGDYVIVDIFKLENCKVVEHWDVIQPIPEKAANDNGMF